MRVEQKIIGAFSLLCIVSAAHKMQLAVIETLDSHADSVDSQRFESLDIVLTPMQYIVRIDLNRKFFEPAYREFRLESSCYCLEFTYGEDRRCTAAYIKCTHIVGEGAVLNLSA